MSTTGFVFLTRAMFREMDGLTKMVSFIGNPEYASLHVLAVIVLSNCLEDLESVEVRHMTVSCIRYRI